MVPRSLCRFVRFESEQHLLRRRWLLPLVVTLVVAYLVIGNLVAQAANHALSLNAWDALFRVFADQYILFYVLTPLFLYLVSDFLPESVLGQNVLLRLDSRKRWWLGKALGLGLAVVLYLLMAIGIVAVAASAVLPWQDTWSTGVTQRPEEFWVVPAALVVRPAYAFAQLLLLLALGWFGLGLVVLAAALLLNRSSLGFLAGLFTLLSGMAALRGEIPPPFSYLFIHQHLLFNLHSFGALSTSELPVFISILYWMLWSVLFFAIGLRISRQQDFLS